MAAHGEDMSGYLTSLVLEALPEQLMDAWASHRRKRLEKASQQANLVGISQQGMSVRAP
jgi:hypothetical protein